MKECGKRSSKRNPHTVKQMKSALLKFHGKLTPKHKNRNRKQDIHRMKRRALCNRFSAASTKDKLCLKKTILSKSQRRFACSPVKKTAVVSKKQGKKRTRSPSPKSKSNKKVKVQSKISSPKKKIVTVTKKHTTKEIPISKLKDRYYIKYGKNKADSVVVIDRSQLEEKELLPNDKVVGNKIERRLEDFHIGQLKTLKNIDKYAIDYLGGEKKDTSKDYIPDVITLEEIKRDYEFRKNKNKYPSLEDTDEEEEEYVESDDEEDEEKPSEDEFDIKDDDVDLVV